MAAVPLAMTCVLYGTTWWYVVVHKQAEARETAAAALAPADAAKAAAADASERQSAESTGLAEPPSQDAPAIEETPAPDAGLILSNDDATQDAANDGAPPPEFYYWFWGAAAGAVLLLLWYYRGLDAEQFVILDLLTRSVMPLGVLTLLVLAVILFGITTATESAGIGAAGAFVLALHARTLSWKKVKEAIFLTGKTTTMIGWLFLGSGLFSAVFALHGGQQLLEKWVLSMSLSPVQFMILSQAIIFVLGWPLEWTEIIVIFVPIFLPMLPHFGIDPILWGTLVFVNLQAAFLSPPVAMSAFYLKGVSPPHVTLNQIFAGMMPYMLIVILCMVVMYVWPGMSLWLPEYLYGH
jgi:TRAP-type mannitol/chloroaromatic compound transport system permease large subunit